MNSYELSRSWFNYCFENPELINPNHTALYFFIIEHCNRLGWKEKFGLPMEMAKEAIGIKNYRTYSKTFNDLIEWGFVKLIQKSKNQYSSNIIAIVKNAKANTKALDKALQKHSKKQVPGIVCIDKQETIEQETINYIGFIEKFNSITGKRIRVPDDKFKRQLKARLNEGFTIDEILIAVSECKKDKYHIENTKFLTPEFITRSDKLQKYLIHDKSSNKPKIELSHEAEYALTNELKDRVYSGEITEQTALELLTNGN